MAQDDKKKGLLTSSLDFEGVDGYASELDDWMLSDRPLGALADKQTTPAKTAAPAATSNSSSAITPTNISSGAAGAVPAAFSASASVASAGSAADDSVKRHVTLKQKKFLKDKVTASASASVKPLSAIPKGRTKNKSIRDNENFTVYVGVGLILAILLSFWVAYAYVQKSQANLSGLSYVVLPAASFNLKGKIFRLQVSVQGNESDADWLQENKHNLNDAFTVAITKLDPDEMSSSEGLLSMQEKLKTEMNAVIPGEHVQAVLLNQLLIQNGDE